MISKIEICKKKNQVFEPLDLVQTSKNFLPNQIND